MQRPDRRARRASEADREAAMEQIRQAYAAGRIDLDDLDSRVAVALLCVTVRELTDLTSDLPPASGHC